jgi:ABC-type branched-subunit amino acid transport system ATPase component
MSNAVANEPGTLGVKGVSKSFGGTAAVHSADLELRRGRVVGLIGPNGSGKTTLLNIVSGVIRSDSWGGRTSPDGRWSAAREPGSHERFRTFAFSIA